MAEKEFWIIGPPGTGKTTYLSRQIKQAVEAHGPKAVFVSSFTRAAAVELIGRNLPIPKERVGTLHAHCFRALGCPEIAELHLDDWNKANRDLQLSDESHRSKSVEDTYQEQSFDSRADEIFNRYQLFRQRLVRRQFWPADVNMLANRWERWKEENDLVDFTEMIERGLEELEEPPGGAKVAFFDEVQDMSPLELALVRKWKARTDLTLLAFDDDQMIYRFRGAKFEALIENHVPDTHKRLLSQSYRVPGLVWQFSQQWVKGLSKREPKEYKPREELGKVTRALNATYSYPEPLLPLIEKDLADGKTVMILTTCSYMLRPIISLFRKNGFPFHNPFRRSRGDWNPLQVSHGTSTSDRILAYLRPDTATWGEQARFWAAEDLKKWAEHLDSKFLLHGAKAAIKDLQIPGDHNLVNDFPLSALLEFFPEEGLSMFLQLDLDYFKSALLPSKLGAYLFPLHIAQKRGAATLRKRPSLVVGTIHSVKGGEADVVYLFPDLSNSGAEEYRQPGDPRDSVIRQFYVGITRARERLVLCGPCGPAVNFNKIQVTQDDRTLAAMRIFGAVEVA
jgi:DNA helicase-2/ATP-dependent DNA helicase PcrA